MQREPLPQYATDDQIETLVATFYARIRRDEVLGPIFLAAIGEDWTAHLKTMCDFWSSVMNTSGRYKGKPIPAHVKLPGIEPRHFEHWLRLFSETVHSLFDRGARRPVPAARRADRGEPQARLRVPRRAPGDLGRVAARQEAG